LSASGLLATALLLAVTRAQNFVQMAKPPYSFRE
jgi:hypothetical protein